MKHLLRDPSFASDSVGVYASLARQHPREWHFFKVDGGAAYKQCRVGTGEEKKGNVDFSYFSSPFSATSDCIGDTTFMCFCWVLVTGVVCDYYKIGFSFWHSRPLLSVTRDTFWTGMLCHGKKMFCFSYGANLPFSSESLVIKLQCSTILKQTLVTIYAKGIFDIFFVL